jgi:hypothetical protein
MRAVIGLLLACSITACVDPESFEGDESVEASELEQMKLVTPQCTQAGQELGPSGHYSVPVANNGSSRCWMDRGNVSSGVRSLQRALVFCWQQNIGIDGEYGPQTQQAVRNLQTALRITVDGGYGPQTRGAMGNHFAGALFDVCAN